MQLLIIAIFLILKMPAVSNLPPFMMGTIFFVGLVVAAYLGLIIFKRMSKYLKKEMINI